MPSNHKSDTTPYYIGRSTDSQRSKHIYKNSMENHFGKTINASKMKYPITKNKTDTQRFYTYKSNLKTSLFCCNHEKVTTLFSIINSGKENL